MGSLADGCSGSALPPTADRLDMVGGAANPAPRGAAAQRPARLFSSLPGPRIRVPLSLLGHRFRLPPARSPGGGGSIISAHYPRFLGSDFREEHRGLRRGLGRGTQLVADVYRADGALPRPLRPHAFPRRLGGPRRRARPATGAPRRRFRPPSSPVRGTATRRGRRRRPRRQAGRGANGPWIPRWTSGQARGVHSGQSARGSPTSAGKRSRLSASAVESCRATAWGVPPGARRR